MCCVNRRCWTAVAHHRCDWAKNRVAVPAPRRLHVGAPRGAAATAPHARWAALPGQCNQAVLLIAAAGGSSTDVGRVQAPTQSVARCPLDSQKASRNLPVLVLKRPPTAPAAPRGEGLRGCYAASRHAPRQRAARCPRQPVAGSGGLGACATLLGLLPRCAGRLREALRTQQRGQPCMHGGWMLHAALAYSVRMQCMQANGGR